MGDMMKMWAWMMTMMTIIFLCFLYARDVGMQYEELIEDFAECIEYHDANYETCSTIMIDAFDDVDWLGDMVIGK